MPRRRPPDGRGVRALRFWNSASIRVPMASSRATTTCYKPAPGRPAADQPPLRGRDEARTGLGYTTRGDSMADTRLNGIIRALEAGQHAFTAFTPTDVEAAIALTTAKYDGIVFEMEHN